jgi:tetratricopeptide (TPR) repeat protein
VRRGRFAVVALLLLLVPASARADGPPSRWDRAKDPDKFEDYRLHKSVQRTFPLLDDTRRFRPDLFDRIARDLIVSLESWNAENSTDPRLRFDLGRALEEHGEHLRAAKVLKAAIELDPNHPIMDEAWLFLGFACGHIGDHACERDSYLEVLRRDTEDYRRLLPMLNLSEVEMHLGNLKESIALYHETLHMAARLPTSTTTPLAQWGLAVAYDRAGDRLAAEREAKMALELERSMHREGVVDEDGVFFYPAYEILYYHGMAAVARARAAASAHDAAISWAEAERKFEGYVKNAERRNPTDRFLSHARARYASCKAERQKAEKRGLKEPRKRGDDEDLPL